jgi:tetratricopeptide (TPR) repeat protein
VPGPSERLDFDAWWDYNDPGPMETKFLELLPRVEAGGDPSNLAELLTQLARTQGLQMRFEDADHTLDRAESLVTEDMPRARVRLLMERGRVRNSSGDPSASAPLFEEAFALARSAGLDGLAVDAAHMLGIVEPGDSGIAWNERALTIAEESADPNARRWRGSLCNNLGWSYHALGRHDEALRMFRVHLAIQMEDGDAEMARIARWSIAKTYRFQERLEEAMVLQTELLSELERDGGRDGFVHEELGECLLALGREAEARPHFARAWELLHEDRWLARDEPDRLSRLAELGGRR